MTRQRSFKRLVRTRMEKTGESYTAARASLLTAEEPDALAGAVLMTSDASIRERTGRGWEEWFDLLDDWGAAERSHRDTARWVAEQQGIHPLAWNAQAVVSSYERTRGLRAAGEHADGFTVTASKTVAVPVDQLYDAFVDAVAARALAARRRAPRTDRHEAEVGAVRLGRRRDPGQRHVRGEGRREEHRGAPARAPCGRHGGGADEGLLARTRRDAEGGGGAMTRVTRVGTVIVPVSDQDRALEFYVGTLGFEKRLDGEFGAGRWIEVAPPGAATSLALVPADSIEVSLATEDADADHAELLARGVEADAEVMRMGDFVPPMFTFRDPDGNRFRMVERD